MAKAKKENQPTAEEQQKANVIVQMREQYKSNLSEDELKEGLDKDEMLNLKIIEMLFTQYQLVLPPIDEILKNAKMIKDFIKGKD